jgi:hypothetical protein
MPQNTETGRAIFPQTVMAMAVLDASVRKVGLQVEDISELFVDLEEKSGTKVLDVALRAVPNGFYSEDVESFVGRFLASGYATARSPIVFDESGLKVCREMVQKALRKHPDEVKKVAATLHYNLDKIIDQVSR